MESMYDFREIALATMRDHNRAALERMQKDGTLEDLLHELVQEAEDKVNSIAFDLRKQNPLPDNFLERVRRLNQYLAVAREFAASELVEFLSVPEG